MRSQLALTLAAALAAAVGCNGDDDGGGDEGPNEDLDASAQAVRCPDDIPDFSTGETSGLETMGVNEEIKARLVLADKVPPAKYSNTWTIELMSADGTPLEDAEIVKACAYMPVHLHGLPPRGIEPLDEPGRFKLDRLNFSMRGPWEVQLAVSSETVPEASARGTDCEPSATGTDYLVFDVCVKND